MPAAVLARPTQCDPCKVRAAQRTAAERRNCDKALSLELRLHHNWPECESELCQRRGGGRRSSASTAGG